jgi:hypothetical protein
MDLRIKLLVSIKIELRVFDFQGDYDYFINAITHGTTAPDTMTAAKQRKDSRNPEMYKQDMK